MTSKLVLRLSSYVSLLLLALTASVQAQGFDPFAGLEGLDNGLAANDPNLQVTGKFVVDPEKQIGQIEVTAKVDDGWYLYSITQKPGGPLPSKLTTPANIVAGKFVTNQKPKVVPPDDIMPVPQEKHYHSVTWKAPFVWPQGVDPKTLTLAIKYSGQTCSDAGTCVPQRRELQAKYAGDAKIEVPADFKPTNMLAPSDAAAPPMTHQIMGKVGDFKTVGGHSIIRGNITPKVVEPGGKVRVELTVEVTDGYHVYAYDTVDPLIYKPTVMGLATATPWKMSPPTTENPVIEKEFIEGEAPLKYHHGNTTWSFEITVPKDAALGEHPIVGFLGYQTCTDATCDRPAGIKFEALVKVGAATDLDTVPLALSEAPYSAAADAAAGEEVETAIEAPQPGEAAAIGGSTTWQVVNSEKITSLYMAMLLALVGGGLLNFMPCVLPVVGLKIMAFAHQGGEHRTRVLGLNAVYTLGLLSVFWALAVLAIGAHVFAESAAGDSSAQGWGSQFGNPWFSIPLLSLVFVMALSFLGVWELQIPGFIGGSTAGELTSKEGYSGAFFKGIFTTLLATPCSGPFLGPVFGFTLASEPYVTFLVFTCIGLGMASPYLVVAAFPSLIRFLPKPGAWMETFKNLMGFVLLGTVVYLLTVVDKDYLLPTLALLVFLGIGCWILQLTPPGSEFGTSMKYWGAALAVAIVGAYGSFSLLVKGETQIPWQYVAESEYATIEQDLLSLQKSGQTVMVDFTATWCPNCKYNFARVIDTQEVAEVVKQNSIVPKIIDYTNEDPPLKALLNGMGYNSIPMFAVFPANRPGEVYVLSDVVSKQGVIGILNDAGPSVGDERVSDSAAAKTAMVPH
ncbi:protein-disulfide reductase DsbD family protein [Blastopirellula marina]|uniref:Thiol:disulfide interchange protein dsbD (Precursor) n=1 Tax=Blastopirellula marina DSM 3645 TaxID=314230 RepID=A4A2G9_9BACT|nr:protein-disulfide reductase DsbD [Blastopirellula marina]EAQ77036.1 thiol:disulfide interchange protein dsbD (precursor) [Blastopirellula marina DSM 3645]